MDFEAQLRALLAEAERQDLLRTPQTYEARGVVVRSQDGVSFVSFASNDYLGLADHPALRRSLAEGAAHLAGAGSSRVVAGTSSAHRAAEAALAELVGLPSSRVFPSAYAANLALLGSLFGRGDLLLSDSLNHASLIDGCRLSRARVEVYEHGNLDHVRDLLEKHRSSARLAAVVTETAFSMDGDIADVAALWAISREHRAALLVDEAHAVGVIGPHGAGVCAQAGIRPDVLVGGLGKAFGLAGGFVVGSPALARVIDNLGRPFVFSTAVLPALAHAIPTSVELVRASDAARATVQRHAERLRALARSGGRSVLGKAPSPIVPVLVGGPEDAMAMAARLRERGFLVPAMRPPTVPVGTSRLRITPTALHTDAQIANLGTALSP